ncbi:MAG TPA: HD domain-containing protein [Candidatus Bathyarchaeia archaeon]|nr:HD domain-containing protein [Candidatus Bathyarchaeia archaeon]
MKLSQLEDYLQKKIFPELEKGRPDFDKPHTVAVVKKLKEILKNSPALKLDKIVLIIAAYSHDWGYAGLFQDGMPVQLKEVNDAKNDHREIGAKKLAGLLRNKFFNFLTREQKKEGDSFSLYT